MNVVEIYRGFKIINHCGQWFIEFEGNRSGPFSNLMDAKNQVDRLPGGAKNPGE